MVGSSGLVSKGLGLLSQNKHKRPDKEKDEEDDANHIRIAIQYLHIGLCVRACVTSKDLTYLQFTRIAPSS